MKRPALGLVLLLLTFGVRPAFCQDAQSTQTADPKETVELKAVISQVKAALDDYQASLGGADALPPLSTAEFDFKTTVATTVGGSINLFIFKIGVSRERDTVNDVTYTYSVPKPSRTERTKPPKELKDELVETIKSAAAAIKNSGTLGKLPFSKLTVNLSYGVKWDGSAGINAPISLVTVGLTGDKNKNYVQSVKLTFGATSP
jgi:hypothetical protein